MTNKETSNNRDKTCKMIKHSMGNKTLVFMANNLTNKIKIWKITKTNLINSNLSNSKSNSEMLKINNPKKVKLKREKMTKKKAKILINIFKITSIILDKFNWIIKRPKLKIDLKLNLIIKLIDSKEKSLVKRIGL